MKEFTQEIVDDFVIDKICKGYLLKVSDRQFDDMGKSMVREFLENRERHNPLDCWNFIKELLDMCVCASWCSSFEIAMLDLESYYNAPIGAYCQKDGTINNSPWRIKMSKYWNEK